MINVTDPIVPYGFEKFDSDYYNNGARGGFPSYVYDDPVMQEQLGIKWDVCSKIPHESVLFVGCAKGFEVKYWWLRGKFAQGVDVSEYAIQNAEPVVKEFCHIYNGSSLARFDDNSFDMVAAFDVLTLVPNTMRENLIREMIRVAKNGIFIRTIVKNWRNMLAACDGMDGVSFHYETFDYWDRAFTQSEKFALYHNHHFYNYECCATFLAQHLNSTRK